jgi:hypothetical protein
MDIVTYTKDIPLFKKILGFFFLALSLYSLLSFSLLFGSIFLVIGINLLLTEGSEINLKTNTYRNIKSLFGFRFGKWMPCPEFEYVSVFKTKENQTIRVITAETTLQNDIILLNLFYRGNKHITFYKTQNRADAFKMAEEFKSIFKIDILDATESEKKWL